MQKKEFHTKTVGVYFKIFSIMKFYVKKGVIQIPAENGKGTQRKDIYYAEKLPGNQVKLDKICKLIGERSAIRSGDVKATLDNLGWALSMVMDDGSNVSLPGLGTFSTRIKSKATEKADDFSSDRIQKVSIHFNPDKELRRTLQDVRFRHVSEIGMYIDSSVGSTNNSGAIDPGADKDTGEEDNPYIL